MPRSCKAEREAFILDLITRQDGLTNVEIASATGLTYRAVQSATRELEGDGRIVGRWNHFGRQFSNVSWWAVRCA